MDPHIFTSSPILFPQRNVKFFPGFLGKLQDFYSFRDYHMSGAYHLEHTTPMSLLQTDLFLGFFAREIGHLRFM